MWNATNQVYFTYSVEWKESTVAWASRWDIYYREGDEWLRWLSTIKSIAIVLLLSGELCKHRNIRSENHLILRECLFIDDCVVFHRNFNNDGSVGAF